MDFSMNGPVTQVARLQQGFRQNVKNAGSETLESRRAAVRRAHRHVALSTCQSGKGTTPLARHSSTRVLRSHRPSRFRAGAPLRQWGTLVKSRANRPIFAPEAPFVAGGLRELRTLRPGPVRPAANSAQISRSICRISSEGVSSAIRNRRAASVSAKLISLFLKVMN